MSTTVRDLVEEDEVEEDKDQGEEDDDEEDEDADYAPSAGEGDSDSDGDLEYDETAVEVGPVADSEGKGRGAKRQAPKPKKPAKKKKKAGGAPKRGGGIALSDDEAAEAAAAGEPDEAADEAAGEAGGPSEAEAEAASSNTKVDDLWAEMNGGAPAAKPARAVPGAAAGKAGGGSGSGGGGGAAGKGGGLDIKALLAKTAGAASRPSDGGGAGSGMVTITQAVDFCGEELVVTKQVKAGSKEHLAYQQREAGGIGRGKGAAAAAAPSAKPSLQQAVDASSALQRQMAEQGGAASSVAEGLEFKPALPAPKLPAAKPTGLQGLLASLDGKKKMSTMEKSRHDWGNFKSKQDEATRDEMDRFAKDGYLAKQAFLARTDERQAEVARSNRRRGMGLKD